jgi:two-component system OmpR family response regulator
MNKTATDDSSASVSCLSTRTMVSKPSHTARSSALTQGPASSYFILRRARQLGRAGSSHDRGMEQSTPQYAAFLVEDSALIRENLIVAMNEVAGTCVVACAESEAEALRWLQQHPHEWQLAVIDMFLKEGSGLAVLKRCQSRAPSQRAVVLTNYADSDIRVQCIELGADAVFDKSTELDAFLDYCVTPRSERGGVMP